MEVVWFLLRNICDSLKNQWLHCNQQDISLLFLNICKNYGDVTCRFWFLALQVLEAETAKNCIFVWLVLIIKFDSSQNTLLNFLGQNLSQQFQIWRASFKNFAGNVSHIGKSPQLKMRKIPRSFIYPENQTFCSAKLLATFCQSEYQSAPAFLFSWKNSGLPNKKISSLQGNFDGPKQPKVQRWSDLSFYSKSALKTTAVIIASVKISINSFVFVENDSKPIFSVFNVSPEIWYAWLVIGNMMLHFSITFFPQLPAALLHQDVTRQVLKLK